MSYKLLQGDCLEVLPGLADGSVDAIICDPPYGIGYASSRTTRNGGGDRVSRPNFGNDVFDARWLTDAYRALRDTGAMYLCTRWDVIQDWRRELKAVGFDVPQRIVWDKSHWGMGDLRYYGSQVEDILFSVKGEHTLNWDKRQGNLWNIWKGLVWTDIGGCCHPTQKPVELMRRMIQNSTKPADTVLDPFMGSGTTGVACMMEGRNFIGIELDPGYFEIAQRRIADAAAQPRLIPDEDQPQAERLLQPVLGDGVQMELVGA